MPYAQLVWATGTRARQLPSLPTNLDNVYTLRTAHDATQLRSALQGVERVTFIGGGFIGLELAATLQSLGKHVTVLESQGRLLSRAVSEELSSHVLDVHQKAGVDIRLNSQIKGFAFESHRVTHIELADETLAVECVLMGIGAEPEDALARQIGLACVMEREDPRDAWVSPQWASLEDLPPGAVVGTSSLRRTVLLQALRPDLVIEPLRGNLDTRLKKLDAGQYAGIVLAAAGLKRLGLQERIRRVFEVSEMLPAPGQGALGLEVMQHRGDVIEALSALSHQSTWLAVSAERAVSRAMGGSCSMPLAAHATQQGEYLTLHAAWGDLTQPGRILRAHTTQEVADIESAQQVGTWVAQQLIDQGAQHQPLA